MVGRTLGAALAGAVASMLLFGAAAPAEAGSVKVQRAIPFDEDSGVRSGLRAPWVHASQAHAAAPAPAGLHTSSSVSFQASTTSPLSLPLWKLQADKRATR